MLNNTATDTLATIIEQLGLLGTGRTSTFDDLVALNIARECIDELFHDCVDELSAGPETANLWSAVISAGKLTSKSRSAPARISNTESHATRKINLFWKTFETTFTWDFLPGSFLYAVYKQWLTAEFPGAAALPKKTFTRRLNAAAAASGEWAHNRSRPGSLMSAEEPLLTRASGWSPDESDCAVWGLRRSGR